MDDRSLNAFFSELEELSNTLEKVAGVGGFLKKHFFDSLVSAGKTFGGLAHSPVKTMKAGWAGMGSPGVYAGDTGLGARLARGGWTGSGELVGGIPVVGRRLAKVTKYLPLGQKSMFTGMGLAGAPAMAKGVIGKDGQSMESALESVGNNVGWVAGSPVPIVGNIAGMTALSQGGKYLGRGIDKVLGRKTQGLGNLPPSTGTLGSAAPGVSYATVRRFGE